jgi:enoyl-CoA hydratase
VTEAVHPSPSPHGIDREHSSPTGASSGDLHASRGLAVWREGAIAALRLQRPEQRNALTDELLGTLAETLASLDADPDVRCLLLTGGEDVFASGADVAALAERDAWGIFSGDRARAWESIQHLTTPLIAAVSGLCLGAGLELALIADIVIASPTARFGLPETQLGLIPGAGGTQRLPRAIGKAKAMDVILSGRVLDAAEAERAGLTSRTIELDNLLPCALKVARRIAERPPAGVRLAKQAVDTAAEAPLSAGLAAERRAFALAFATDDAREGMTAFIEKRPPRWRGDRPMPADG